MIVYIVSQGEKHEGGQVITVHTREESAISAALNVPTSFIGDWVSKGKNYWENGCDYVTVTKHYVVE